MRHGHGGIMDMNEMRRMLMGQGGEDDQPKPAVAKDIDAVRLSDACTIYLQRHSFKVGDLIRRKGGICGDHPIAPPTGLYIVMDVFPEAREPGARLSDLQTYGLCLDLYLGFYDEDGVFQFAPSDSRRYEPVPEEDIVP